jgi:uncharacterized SAM-binding protein YcdF (DUF218 family)
VEIGLHRVTQWLGLLALAAMAFLLTYLTSLSIRIDRESHQDDARPADVILVMGAAEYRGQPSPVLKRRLDHAVELYQKKLAPYIMTTGGPGGDPSFTEAGVGRSYLIDRGIPAEAIIVEEQGDSTAMSLSASAEILRRMALRSCIVVSDGYHIFRVKRMLQQEGFTAYGSPREHGEIGPLKLWWLCFKQAIGYGLWRVGVRV